MNIGDIITIHGAEYTAVPCFGVEDQCKLCALIEETCGGVKEYCHGENPFVLAPSRHVQPNSHDQQRNVYANPTQAKPFYEILAGSGFELSMGEWLPTRDFENCLVELLGGMYENIMAKIASIEEHVASAAKDSNVENLDLSVDNILQTDVKDLDIPVRLINCLRSVEMRTLGDALSVKRTELLKIRHLGVGSLRSLDKIVNDCGLHYGKMTLREWGISKTLRNH